MKTSSAVVLIAILLSACSPDSEQVDTSAPVVEAPPVLAPPVDTLSEADLVSEWLAMAKEPEAYIGNQRPLAICIQLDSMHPTALVPIVELLGQPDTSDTTKIFVLQNINFHMDMDYLPYILPLLVSEFPTTRSCATTLLGTVPDESVIEPLLRMKQDSDSRVAFSALSGLALHGEEPYRRDFVQYYLSPEVTISQRREIVRIIMHDPRPEDEFIISAILMASDTPPTVRHLLVMTLGNMGTESSIKAIHYSTSLDPSEEYRTLVDTTVAVIQERSQLTQ